MKIPGTTIEVDDFRPRDATLWALTHYHADHRRGLRMRDPRPILCSSLTARLLAALHGIAPATLTTLDPGEDRALADGIHVRAFDANHCPGALMFLFEVAGRRVLHTGDFRYCAAHDGEHELFRAIDVLMLDATFESATGEHAHPPQEEAIERVLALIEQHPGKRVHLGVYRIGKNRVVAAIRQRLGLRVHLPEEYHRIYELIGMGDCVTRDRASTRIHGHPLSAFDADFERSTMRAAEESIVILPTGWRAGRHPGRNFHLVPYSEHNSSAELQAFVAKVAPREVVRTNDFF